MEYLKPEAFCVPMTKEASLLESSRPQTETDEQFGKGNELFEDELDADLWKNDYDLWENF